jgi:hypothetical protein
MMGDPSPIETMAPKLALHGRGGMAFAAVETAKLVETRIVGRSGENRRVGLGSLLAACRELTVGVLTVRAGADSANDTWGGTGGLSVRPPGAASAERRPNLEVSRAEDAGGTPETQGASHEGLHPGPRLRVPDIKVDSTTVRRLRVANDPGRSRKSDVRRIGTGGKNPTSLIRGEGGQTVTMEWNTENTKERPGGWNLAGGLGSSWKLGLRDRACKLKVSSERNTGGSEGNAPVCQTVRLDAQGARALSECLGNVPSDGEEINIPHNIHTDDDRAAGWAVGSVPRALTSRWNGLGNPGVQMKDLEGREAREGPQLAQRWRLLTWSQRDKRRQGCHVGAK